ncbi:MAG TPA: glycerate kinase [Nocardioidaceae bacterium]|nr:glycerate kinase [Nocardioidaceae bacterium]
MRVLVSPDKFAGTLTAVHAADAIAEGWLQQAPGDEIRRVPMADGGPGFLDVLHNALGGELLSLEVSDPFGALTLAGILMVGDTAYIESSQACGRHLTEPYYAADAPVTGAPEDAGTAGVGQLMMTAINEGARKLVVGLGAAGTNDAGAGMLRAFGLEGDATFDVGAAGLEGVGRTDLTKVRECVGDTEIVFAADVDNPLLGLIGTTNVYGEQKGIGEERKQAVDSWLESFANATDRRLANQRGAGAAGGLGFGLLLLGGTGAAAVDLVAEAVGLADHARWADLVVTGEGAFDFRSRSGNVAYGVAETSTQAVRPCIALAGQVLVGSREMRAMGIESAYSVLELVGHDEAFARPYDSLARLARRVARTWSRSGD